MILRAAYGILHFEGVSVTLEGGQATVNSQYLDEVRIENHGVGHVDRTFPRAYRETFTIDQLVKALRLCSSILKLVGVDAESGQPGIVWETDEGELVTSTLEDTRGFMFDKLAIGRDS